MGAVHEPPLQPLSKLDIVFLPTGGYSVRMKRLNHFFNRSGGQRSQRFSSFMIPSRLSSPMRPLMKAPGLSEWNEEKSLTPLAS